MRRREERRRKLLIRHPRINVGVRLPVAIIEWLDHLATAQRRTRSTMLRILVEDLHRNAATSR
jgi:predicted transcriptional regulator